MIFIRNGDSFEAKKRNGDKVFINYANKYIGAQEMLFHDTLHFFLYLFVKPR